MNVSLHKMEPCFLMSSSIWPLLHNLYIGKLNYCPTMWGRKNKRCYSERLSEHIENLGNMMWIFYELNRNKLGIQRIKTHLPQPLLLPLKPKRKRLCAQLGDPIETAHQVGWVDEWQGLWIENIVSCIPLSLWTSVSYVLAILMHLPTYLSSSANTAWNLQLVSYCWRTWPSVWASIVE